MMKWVYHSSFSHWKRRQLHNSARSKAKVNRYSANDRISQVACKPGMRNVNPRGPLSCRV